MPAYKDGKTWRLNISYKDASGKLKQKTKRGFKSKKEALEWEREFFYKEEFSSEMSFQSLYELYMEDMESRLKKNTIKTKEKIIELKILPFFKDIKINEITPIKIRNWQNKLINTVGMNGAPLAPTYLKTINNQLSAIFNYAVTYHNLKENPVKKAGSIGKKRADEMQIWTVEEFELFSNKIKDKPISHVAFNILFWTGLRIGELLALTIADFDYAKKTLRVNKSYQRIEREDIITLPKTQKSIRVISLPQKVADLIQAYIGMFYKPTLNVRLFPNTKYTFESDMKIYSKLAGVKKIRLHDLRHSHASYLFNHGVDVITIAKRLGHENIETTLEIYAHTYQTADDKLLKILNKEY